MIESLIAYKQACIDIGKVFELPALWHNLVDCTNEPWTDYGDMYNTVGWGCETLSYGFEAECDFEVYGKSRWEADGYVLFVGDDGCGNRDMYLFRANNKVEE